MLRLIISDRDMGCTSIITINSKGTYKVEYQQLEEPDMRITRAFHLETRHHRSVVEVITLSNELAPISSTSINHNPSQVGTFHWVILFNFPIDVKLAKIQFNSVCSGTYIHINARFGCLQRSVQTRHIVENQSRWRGEYTTFHRGRVLEE